MKSHVFVNRTLNMKKIKYIGLDMDHTLIRYHSERFETLVYQFVINYLIANKHYPVAINDLSFKYEHAIRGSVVDSQNGNILKLSRYGAIRQSYHGTQPIQFTEQKQIYRSIYVDLNDPNYIAIDTSFSIAFCVLFGQLIDFKDKNPASLPSYETIAFDILYSVDKVHANGELKQYIAEHLDHYVIREPHVVEGLKRFKDYGKQLFILTNSEFPYTKLMLDYAINPYLPTGETWQTLFEYVITLSDKPRFFYDNLKFLKINPDNASMNNVNGSIVSGIYQGGSAKKFTHDLSLNGDEILYIGDHIYGDILRLKKDCNWRTALVVDELGSEIEAQEKSLPVERNISAAMDIKTDLEQQYITLQTKSVPDHMPKCSPELQQLQAKISDIDTKIAALLKEQHAFFNPTWGRVFRAGAEESYFAYQVERYACIYMEKLADLLEQSPLTYFRAPRRRLAHDSE
ncbi:MAG: HAD-IG family 5'-nucleotidase [Legionellaceae bacterium]|nr:HAD-IG family 5'-nucleotidase [Legionellaceae bacterium]